MAGSVDRQHRGRYVAVAMPLLLALAVITAAPPSDGQRAVSIGPSVQYLLQEPYAGAPKLGVGVGAIYEFVLKPQFILGIQSAYRYYPDDVSMHQLGYGLILRHYLAGLTPEAVFSPYLAYGLLLQISVLKNRLGSATAHDTRLTAGGEVRIAGRRFVVDASYHFSRIRFFGEPQLPLDNLELSFGHRHLW